MITPTQFIGGASLGALVYFYFTSNVFRYYAKFTFFSASMVFCASAFIPLMLFRPMSYKNALLPSFTLTLCGRLLGVRCKISGTENIVKDSACVVLMNHQSMVDCLVFAYLWPKLGNSTVIAKKEIFYMWPFGLACWLWGTIYIDRLSGENAKRTINETAAIITRKKAKLCMFPEGTRHGGDDLLPFKKGAFHVAISSQCPLQPIIVSRYYFLDSKKHIFDPGFINVEILPAVPTTGLTKDDMEKLMADTRSIMNTRYKELSEETLVQVREHRE